MKKQTLIVIVLGVVVASFAVAGPELSGTPDELAAHLRSLPGQVTLTGEAEKKVEANRAEVVIKVRNSDRSFNTALLQNQLTRTDIMARLEKSEIPAERIHMARFSSTPTQGYFTSKVKSYDVESRVTVEVSSEKELQAVAAVVDEKDGVSLLSLTFSNTDKAKHTEEVLNQALAKINDLKQIYEKQLRVTLRARAVGPQPGIAPTDHMQQRSYAHKNFSGIPASMGNPEMAVVLHALEQREPDISQFDQVVYTATVNVTFDVVREEGK